MCKQVALVLNVDPRKANQTVRGTVQLPRGSGKSVREGAREGGSECVCVCGRDTTEVQQQ